MGTSGKYLVKTKNVTSINKGCCSHQDSAATPKGGAPEETQDEKATGRWPQTGRCTPKELQEEPLLTPCWICFFDHCWPLLSSGNPAPLHECQTKVASVSSQGDKSDPHHLSMATEKKKNEQIPSYCAR